MSARRAAGPLSVASRALAAALVGCLLLPPLALALTVELDDFREAFARGLWTALWLSLWTTTLSAASVTILGTPLAWWLARARGPWVRPLETLVRLPAVTPPAVAGVALLAAFGRRGLLGGVFEAIGWSPAFTTAAVILAQLFVAAPFFVLPLAEAFRGLDEELLWTARSLGAGGAKVFFGVALPLCAPALWSGLAVAWARALGEFGATLVFAGNLPGVTQTLPIAIYTAMEGDLGPARAMSLVLLGGAIALFVGLRSAAWAWPSARGAAR